MEQTAHITSKDCASVIVPKRKVGRPRVLTDDERREKRRLKSAKQRAENPERIREITRNSMRRAAAGKAIAAGREPGQRGAPRQFTEEEKRAKRNEKSKRYYWANRDAVLSEAVERERNKRKAVKEGTFVPAEQKRLTEEERRLTEVAWSATRRARLRKVGGSYTRDDVAALRILQKGKCAWCLLPLSKGKVHVDHNVPIAKGGSNDRRNLRLLHETCNLTKAAHHPLEHGLRSGLLCW